jgi:hypothetical protein
MQLTAANSASPDGVEHNRAWLVMAGRHWSAGTSMADEFAMQAVGRVLLHDIATAPTKRFDTTA